MFPSMVCLCSEPKNVFNNVCGVCLLPLEDKDQATDIASKWYGKIFLGNEGIYTYEEFDTKEAAEKYISAFLLAKEISTTFALDNNGDDPLEYYWVSVDQVTPLEK